MNSNSAPVIKEKQSSTSSSHVFSIKNYRYLLIAQAVSDLGDGVYAMALIWAMKIMTGSSLQMSIILVAEIVPLILLGMIAGVFVDSWSKRKIMVVSDLFRGGIVLILSVLSFLSLLAPWMLIVGAVLLSSFSAFFSPARTVAVRYIVPENLIMQAQSFSTTVQTIVGLLAPVISGILISIDIKYAFLFNAISYLLSLVFIVLIKHEALIKKTTETLRMKELGEKILIGYKAVWEISILRGLVIYLIAINFIFAPISILFPLYVTNASELATLEVFFFIGVLSGSLLIGFLKKVKKIMIILLGLSMVLLSFIGMAYSGDMFITVAFVLLMGMGSPLANITLQSLFITKVPSDVLGRAVSSLKVFLGLAKPVSLLLTGSLLVMYSVKDLLLFMSILGIFVVILISLNANFRKE
ncbi:MFS transporter [Brevibacillus ruminantium]|uniref:MFS transporter n=1 Tax=Brevibacillus ruminantium TaxID=2950604 RepID=A0ABY4WDM4_9BACL|nr:MFS transporter [Brevibacillus ruminantium]USG65278.1 MFS transporter [Brevibacillus ruminantium]